MAIPIRRRMVDVEVYLKRIYRAFSTALEIASAEGRIYFTPRSRMRSGRYLAGKVVAGRTKSAQALLTRS